MKYNLKILENTNELIESIAWLKANVIKLRKQKKINHIMLRPLGSNIEFRREEHEEERRLH
ncbi:MAG: hypothetical protein IPL26_28495 [Leptospiraceae bacterium]|nr:hypothetical protein [Leptospiraceae bacterium]